MKKLSRDDMKAVLGGGDPKTRWNCLVQDGAPGGTYYQICSATNPEAYCQYDEGACYSIGTCTGNTLCVV